MMRGMLRISPIVRSALAAILSLALLTPASVTVVAVDDDESLLDQELIGRPVMTIVGGQIVYENLS